MAEFKTSVESKHGMTQSTGILQSRDEPWWFSSRHIRSCIIEAYRIAFPRARKLLVETGRAGADLSARQIARLGLRRLVFTEATPHPIILLSRLFEYEHSVAEICFHVYGNFAHYTPEWADALSLLQHHKIRFKIVVASFAQRGQLIGLLGRNHADAIDVCPFPMTVTPTQVARQKIRRRFGCGPDDFVITYIGRISLMKNVNLLIQFLDRFIRRNPGLSKNIRLFIAGEFDDVGSSFLHLRLNEYFCRWNEWFEKCDESIKSRIRFLGFLDRTETAWLESASDIGATLSTFHDEDFGLAALETLAHGTPVLLSGWGGHHDFKMNFPKATSLIRVRLRDNGHDLSYEDFERSLKKTIQGRSSLDRKSIQKSAVRIYGSRAIGKSFKSIHAVPYHLYGGHSSTLKKHIEALQSWRNGTSPLYHAVGNSDSLYRALYGKYVRPTDL